MKKLIILIHFLLINSLHASECVLTDPEIKSVKVPVNYDSNSLVTFDYHVKIIEKYPGAPYLIFLPGGPGGISMQRNLNSFPLGLNLILTDPRTLGCNSDNPPDSFEGVSTETLANDVLSVIESLGIKNFFLYGESYGTQVATVLASKLEQKKLQPKAIVLQGTSGNERTYLPGYNSVLNKTLLRLPKSVVEDIQNLHPNNSGLLGFSSRTWGYFFLQWLPVGKSDPKTPPFLDSMLINGLGQPENKQGVEFLKLLLSGAEKEANKIDKQGEDSFFLKISCRESYPVIHSDYDLSEGSIIPHAKSLNKCDGFRLDHPYDPSSYSLHAPIWYFQGTEDPNTPLEGALFHFNSQTFSNRTLVKFIGAGHAATASSPKCTEKLWDLILAGKKYDSLDLEKICELPIEVIQMNSTKD